MRLGIFIYIYIFDYTKLPKENQLKVIFYRTTCNYIDECQLRLVLTVLFLFFGSRNSFNEVLLQFIYLNVQNNKILTSHIKQTLVTKMVQTVKHLRFSLEK